MKALALTLAVLSLFAQTKPSPAKGEEIFATHCFECHEAGSSKHKNGPGLKDVKSGKLPSGRSASHDSLLTIIDNGTEEMPAFQDKLTASQKEDLIAFLQTL